MKRFILFFILIYFSIINVFATSNTLDLNKYTKTQEYTNFYLVNKDKESGIILKNGATLIIPTEEKVEVIAYMECCPIINFREKYYYIDNNFEVYEVFNYNRAGNLFYIIKKDDKYGLMTNHGENNIILDTIYDYAEICSPYWVSREPSTYEYNIMMWVKLRKGAWYGYYDCAKNYLSDFKYKDLRVVKKGKFYKLSGLVHYYLQKKTSIGWRYVGGNFYKEIPKRLWEDVVVYYLFLGCVFDSLP